MGLRTNQENTVLLKSNRKIKWTHVNCGCCWQVVNEFSCRQKRWNETVKIKQITFRDSKTDEEKAQTGNQEKSHTLIWKKLFMRSLLVVHLFSKQCSVDDLWIRSNQELKYSLRVGNNAFQSLLKHCAIPVIQYPNIKKGWTEDIRNCPRTILASLHDS